MDQNIVSTNRRCKIYSVGVWWTHNWYYIDTLPEVLILLLSLPCPTLRRWVEAIYTILRRLFQYFARLAILTCVVTYRYWMQQCS